MAILTHSSVTAVLAALTFSLSLSTTAYAEIIGLNLRDADRSGVVEAEATSEPVARAICAVGTNKFIVDVGEEYELVFTVANAVKAVALKEDGSVDRPFAAENALVPVSHSPEDEGMTVTYSFRVYGDEDMTPQYSSTCSASVEVRPLDQQTSDQDATQQTAGGLTSAFILDQGTPTHPAPSWTKNNRKVADRIITGEGFEPGGNGAFCTALRDDDHPVGETLQSCADYIRSSALTPVRCTVELLTQLDMGYYHRGLQEARMGNRRVNCYKNEDIWVNYRLQKAVYYDGCINPARGKVIPPVEVVEEPARPQPAIPTKPGLENMLSFGCGKDC